MNKIHTPQLSNIPISSKVHREYIKFHDVYSKREYLDTELLGAEKKLEDKKTKIAHKKEILFRLAHTPLPEAYEILRKYIFETKGHLRQWTAICLQESQMQVQFPLTNQDQISVSSPAGGDGQRLRMFVVLTTKKGKLFDKTSKKTIGQLICKHVEKNDSIPEKLSWGKNHILISILQSIDVALDDIIIPIMKDGKKYIRYHYYANNTKKLSNKDIKEYIDFLVKENIK